MPAEIIETNGESVLRVTACGWDAEIILSINANMTRLRYRPAGIDLLRSPESFTLLRENPERYGIPLLFPPNRISGGSFSWRGREYRLPVNEAGRNNHIHGLVLGKPFRLERIDENDKALHVETSYTFSSGDVNFSGYPHEFKISLSYTFEKDHILQTATIRNISNEPMPFGLGFHTAFRLPFGNTSEACPTLMCTTGAGYWELDQNTRIPTGKLSPWPESERFSDVRTLTGAPLARLFPLEKGCMEGIPFLGAVVESPGDRVRLIYEFDVCFKHCAIWNDGGDKGFLCIEPMTWMSDAPKLPLPDSTTGLQTLAPGELWHAQSSLRLTSV